MATQKAASHNSGLRSSGNVGHFSVAVCRALSAWTSAKEAIRNSMCREDFQAFVRPMYLVGVLSDNFLLLALPPNRRIAERARNFRKTLSAAIQREGYGFAGFTAYPSEDEMFVLSQHKQFQPFVEIICQGRARKFEEQRSRQDQCDARELLRFLRRQSSEQLVILSRDPVRGLRTNRLAERLLAERREQDARDQASNPEAA